MKRIAPAVGLFFLSPLVAEYLLGDFPVTMLGPLLVMAPFYGGGALLIREVTRRTGRGWPNIFMLGFAYAVIEEAFATQTLFNPNYLKANMHLLDHAYIAWLGMGAWWTFFVITLHVVWSVSVSIALAEALVPTRATRPWLGRVGLGVTIALFAFGFVAMAGLTIKNDSFVARPGQFAGAAVVILVAIVAAFRLPVAPTARSTGTMAPWIVGAMGFFASSLFMLVPPSWGWGAVVLYLALYTLTTVTVWRWSSRIGWGPRNRLALAGGAALTYAWHSFPASPVVPVSTAVDLASNVICTVGLLAVLWTAARRNPSPSGEWDPPR